MSEEELDLFKSEIFELINGKAEGSYWDFKKKWHSSDSSLLHDLICMANNLENKDSYIIIGVDESDNFEVVDVENDPRRKNTNELVTFLRDKRFLGGIRPIVNVKTVHYNGHKLDVLIIKNSNHTPFILEEDFPKDKDNRRVCAFRVYTRVNDSNTPINSNADIDKIEYLWRKRFGIELSAFEKMKLYLLEVNSWVYDDLRARFYYKYDPQFTIQIDNSDEIEELKFEQPRYISGEFYNKLFEDSDGFDLKEYEIRFNDVVLFEGQSSYNDGGRMLMANPEKGIVRFSQAEYFCYFYYVKNDTRQMVNQIFWKYYSNSSLTEFNRIEDYFVTFQDKSEKVKLEKIIQNSEQLILEGKDFPDFVLKKDLKLSENENREYVNAKKAKWLYKSSLMEVKRDYVS